MSNDTVVTILGAGAMGSALATPLRARGHEVRLWGTWLDDHLLAACREGRPHPRTDVELADSTLLFDSDHLDDALDGADVVALAISSEGVPKVTELAAAGLAQCDRVLLTSKGFARTYSHGDQVRLLPDVVRWIVSEEAGAEPAVVAVGGPCKANEVAAGRATATIFASLDHEQATSAAIQAATATYRPATTDDEVGVEVCAPLKNVYAIALGMADGRGERDGAPWHDLRAAAFTQAVTELALLADALGGRAATAHGLAGVGDLEVTGLSGRNGRYGTRIGSGQPAAEALQEMLDAEQTVEGVPACGLAVELVAQRFGHLRDRLPLLHALHDVITGADDPVDLVTEAVLPASPPDHRTAAQPRGT